MFFKTESVSLPPVDAHVAKRLTLKDHPIESVSWRSCERPDGPLAAQLLTSEADTLLDAIRGIICESLTHADNLIFLVADALVEPDDTSIASTDL